MRITITYNILLNQEADEEIISRLEQLTGSRTIYGLDTPISIRDIADNLELSTALICIGYSNEDIVGIVTNLCADAITEYKFIWDYVFPSDSRLFDLVYYSLQYLNTIVAPEQTRFDYCGNPLVSASSFLDDNLASYADNFETYLGTLTDIGTPQQFYRSVFTVGVTEYTNPNYTLIDGPVLDWMQSTYLPNFQQVQFSIEDIFYGVRGPSFLVQSEGLTERTITEAPTQETFPPMYSGISYRNWDSATPLKDQIRQAAITLGYAAVTLARSVLFASKDPVGILASVQTAYSLWTQGKMKEADNNLGRISVMMDAAAAPVRALVGTYDEIEAQIYDAGIQRRIELLNSLAYIQSFDVNQSGFLSTSERGTMELDLRRQMLTARRSKASQLRDAVQNEITEFINSEADIQSIFNLYID